MRARFGFVLVALALSAFLARASDEISWVRMDGTPGWSTSLPHEPLPAGVVPAPLVAPTWFAKFPSASLKLAPEGSFEFASARGKVLLVDYWASWCAPCVKELPHLQALHVAHVADGLVALAVNANEDPLSVPESAKRLGLTMMIGISDPAVAQSLGVRTLPTLFAVDKEGRLRARWDGYKVGIEKEISATVDKLLADDASGTTREMATVVSGQGRLQARWYRDLPGSAEGVVGLSAASVGGARVVASGSDELVSFDATGELVARVKIGSPPGRLLDFGTAVDGTKEIVSFRPGGTALGVVALRSGGERSIAAPAPLLDVVVANDAASGGRRLVMATMSGAASAAAGDARATLITGRADVRSVAEDSRTGVLALSENGTIVSLSVPKRAWAHPVVGAERLLAARDNGAVTATRSVTVAVSGSFLREGGRQIAVATHGGHVLLLDEASGNVVFDAVWGAVHDLGVADLDGDGRDELLVASGRSITVLGAAGR